MGHSTIALDQPDRRAEPGQESTSPGVVGQYVCGKALNTCSDGRVCESAHQLGPDPEALPCVDDGDSEICRAGVVAIPDEARDSQWPTDKSARRYQCFVPLMVNIGEVAHLVFPQVLLVREKPLCPGACAQQQELAVQDRPIRRTDGPDNDEHPRPATHRLAQQNPRDTPGRVPRRLAVTIGAAQQRGAVLGPELLCDSGW